MSKYVLKNKPFFLTHADEDALCAKFADALPSLVYVDGVLWKTNKPPVKSRIADCQSRIVYFWDSSVVTTLPCVEVANGFQGPSSGVVLQFIRSSQSDTMLLSGDIGIGYERENLGMKYVVDCIWKSLSQINASSLVCYSRESGTILGNNIRKYTVGANACLASGRGILLKHNSADVYYYCERNKPQTLAVPKLSRLPAS